MSWIDDVKKYNEKNGKKASVPSATHKTSSANGSATNKARSANTGKSWIDDVVSYNENNEVKITPYRSSLDANQDGRRLGNQGQDYRTELKVGTVTDPLQDAYDYVKSVASTKNTESILSYEQRQNRIKEIDSELSNLSRATSGLGRASIYGDVSDMVAKNDARIKDLKEEKKRLERVGDFSDAEKFQWDIDDKREEVAELQAKMPSTARIAPSQAEEYQANSKALSKAKEELDNLESYLYAYNEVEKLNKLNSYTTEISTKKDFKENSIYSPREPKTWEQLKEEGWKADAKGKWYKNVGLGGRQDYTGEDDEKYTYINDESKRLAIDNYYESLSGVKLYESLGYDTLTEEETGVFNYLYHQDRKNGTNTAEEYLKNISPLLEKRAMEREANKYADLAKEAPALMSAISLGTNFAKALMFPAKAAATATGNYDDMQFLDMYGNRTEAIRGSVSEDMGTVGRLAYNGIMSIGDMGVAMLAGGGNGKVVQAIMSSSAGSSTLSNAKKNGASDGKALVLALGSAAIEWATEKYSIEALLKEPKTILNYIAANTVTEGTEEGASNLSNLALDAIVSEVFGERNEIEQRIDYLVFYEGKSKKEAMQIAFNEKLRNLGEDVLVGGLTGFGMSSVASTPVVANNLFNKTETPSVKTNVGDNTSATTKANAPATNPATPQNATVSTETQPARTRLTQSKSKMPATLYAETLTQNGEALTVDEAMEASGFGIEGAKVLADYVDKNRGIPFSDITGKTLVAYLAGTSNKVDFKAENDLQQAVFEAGRRDRAVSKLSIQNEVGTNKVFSRRESGLITPDSKYKGDLNPITTPMDVSPALARAIDAYGKGIGKKVAFVNNVWVKDGNGKVVGEANAESRSDGVTLLSANAKKKLYQLILHEGVHDFRRYNTDEYHAFIDFALQHQEALGYRIELGAGDATTFERLRQIYSEKGLTLDLEKTLDEIGARFAEKLFGDEATAIEFINKMNETADTRTALQKFMDAIKKIIRKLRNIKDGLVKAGDRAAAKELDMTIAELERGRKLYANAYKATSKAVAEQQKNANAGVKAQKNTATDGVGDYSLIEIDGKNVVWIEKSGLTNKQLSNYQAVEEYIAQHIDDVYTIIESGQKVYIGEDLPKEYTHSVSATKSRNRNKTTGRAKNKAIDGFGELIETSTNRRWEKTKHTHNKDAKYGMYRYDSSFAFPIKDNQENVVNVRAYDVELLIRNASDGRKYLYDVIIKKENTTAEITLLQRESRRIAQMQSARDSASKDTVPQSPESVKSAYSLKDEINSLPAEDKEIVLAARQRAIYSRSIATMSEDRLSKAYSDYSYSNPSSTKGYLAYIEPYDFLSLTTTSTEEFLKKNPQKLNEGVSEAWGTENNIQNPDELYLRIDEQGNVIGHEGRHRMAGLLREDVNRVAVIIKTDRVDNAKPISIKKLSGQDFGNTKSYSSIYVHNMLPISKEYENINRHVFGDVTKGDAFVDPNISYSLMESEGAEVESNLDKVSIQYDAKSKSVAPSSDYSLMTWSKSEYVKDKDVAINSIMKATGVTRADAERYINNINSIARLIADDRERLDYEPNLDENASVIKANSEYKWTVDMSTLCAKRLLYTGTFDAIQKQLPNTAFNSDAIVALRSMMMERGYEVACGICYVESTRRELGAITEDFIEHYKESQKSGKPITRTNSSGKVVELKKTIEQMDTTVDKSTDRFFADKNYTPTLADLNTTDIDLVKRDHPLVYEAYLNFMNARGQAKPKLLETRTEYKGEILKHFASKSAVNARNDAGGLRVQSFSDFEVAHLIDMMQIVLDMSKVKLKSQAYTKVPAFAEVFGNTGMKINLSLIAKGNGLDSNGNLVFDDVEGMPHKEAFRLRDMYSKNVGTILVGKNDAHIKAALADPRIDFVIPFHKSSWKESLYDALGLTGYMDYTDYQNEKPFDKNRKIKNFQPSEYWDYNLSGKENAEVYLQMCHDDKRTPKFPQFVKEDGYWKLLIDFKMYDNDGAGSPQIEVMPEFNMDAATKILNEYEGGHRSLPVAQDVVDDFVAQYQDKDSDHSLMDDFEVSPRKTKELLDTISYLKDQMKVTKLAKADPKKLRTMARTILKDYTSKYDLDEATKALGELYEYIANGEDGHPAVWDDVYSRAKDIASKIVERAVMTDDSAWQTYADLRGYLRSTTLYINPSDIDESVSEFNRRNMGRIRITTTDRNAMGVDEMFQELSEIYPEYFSEDKAGSGSDLLYQMEAVLDSLRPVEFNPFGRDVSDAISSIARDIVDRFYDVPQAKKTFADKKKLEKGKAVQKVVERERNKTKKALEKAKASKEKAIAKERDKRDSRIAKMKESQKAKALRAQIVRSVGELNQALLKGTDKKHIPDNLRGAVLTLLQNINLESNYSYDVESRSYKKNDEGLPSRRTEAVRALQKVYEEIAATEGHTMILDNTLLGAEGETSIFNEILDMSDTRIADMTSEQLEKVYQAIRLVKHSIFTANKTLAMQRAETMDALAADFAKSVSTRRPIHPLMRKHYTLDVQTPVTFFSHFGEAGDAFYQDLRKAQDNEQVMKDKISDVIDRFVSLEYRDKAVKEQHTFKTMGGDEITLTKAHIMNLYLLSKREDAKKHLIYNPDKEYFGLGVVQPEIGRKISRGTESVRLTEADLGKMFTKLTEKDKKICENLQKATKMLAEWGNEVSLRVFGYKKFNDPDYWTIKSAREGIVETQEKGIDTPRSLHNMGAAMPINEKANNALEVYDVFDVFFRHESDMLTYSAYLEVMEDANRFFNYQFKDEHNNRTGKSIKGLLDKYAGDGGSTYYKNLIGDIQNGIKSKQDTAFMGLVTKAYGNAAKMAVAYRLTVIAQQPMSIVRAATSLKIKPILMAMLKGGLNTPVWLGKKVKNAVTGKDGNASASWYSGWEKAVKYSPLAARKRDGGYEITSNSYALASTTLNPKTKWGKFKQAIAESPLYLAGKADEMTWGIMWEACEIETKKNKSLEYGSKEFYEATNELYSKVMNETQVVDGVLQRSQAMRSSNDLARTMTSFTGEPTVGLNCVLRAYDKVRYETDPKRRSGARRALGRAVGVYCLSAVLTAFAKSLAAGLTDDSEEDYWEKVFGRFSGLNGKEETWFDYAKNVLLNNEVVNNLNPLTWLPFSRDLWSILQGYNAERLDVSAMADFGKAATNFIKSMGDEGKMTVPYATSQVIMKGASLLGKSPYNLVRDIEGIVSTFQVGTDDLKALYDTQKMKTKPSVDTATFVDILYKAYTTDNDGYEYIYDDMVKSGVEENKIKNQMESRMMKEEGVESAEDLSKRYFSATDERKYDRAVIGAGSSGMWKSATMTQRNDAKKSLHNFMTSTSESMEELRAEAKVYGVDETDYILLSLAKEMYDEDGNNSLNAKEKGLIVENSNFGDGEIAFFYGTKASDKAYENGIDMTKFALFKAAASVLEGKNKSSKVKSYADKYASNTKEWLYFMGSEYSSYKKRSDYIRYFGKEDKEE